MKLALAFSLAFALPGAAETAADRFAFKRGYSTDIRVQWQNTRDTVHAPGFLDIYPDDPRQKPRGHLEAAGIGWAIGSFSGNSAITDSAAQLHPGVCKFGADAMPTLPPLCRPSGWIAEWRKIGAFCVLDGQMAA